ncbi:hypothetical protein HO133_006063 [Letharia lupina]|uniref:Amino acid transporter n=1 Tax=Letharia lupina TaxID=560253 RepID=A0A8H6F7I5_9LECA|nr:uncharacterized protein HO133_006063 [Letharia lupina]KAF6218105.1 hypothetical protein HO133_006063 [Letharia lupina]
MMEKAQEFRALPNPTDADLLHSEVDIKGANSAVGPQNTYDGDEDQLARLGKKQVLKRSFGFWSTLGFSCALLITWEGQLSVFTTGLSNGGPAGLIYGFIIVWIGTLCVFTTLSELASMAPTAGGQYHWVAMLAPKSSQKILSYITGWLTVLGWQAQIASASYLTGTTIQGVVILTCPTYDPQRWHGTLLAWAVVICGLGINTLVSSILAKIETLILILHIVAFVAILIPLVYLGPHSSPQEVFTVFTNAGGWPTQGLSFFVGLVGPVFAFLGTDGAIHISEEVRNAAIIVPRSMILSVLINGTLGFGMLVAMVFCLGNIDTISSTPPTQYPFMAVFAQAVGSNSGGAGMVAVIIFMYVCATTTSLASSSRMTWSFARDRGLPFSEHLSRINRRTSLPLYPIFLTAVFTCLLALINIGSSVAFNDVISLTVGGLYSSYLICCTLLLWRRCTGGIGGSSQDTAQKTGLHWGPFRIPGVLGIAVNIVACAFVIIIIFFSFWPPATPTTAESMNYSVLVFGGIILFSIAYYLTIAHRTYLGPLTEVEVR